MVKLGPGDPAPDFALPDQQGEKVKLADFQGRQVLVTTSKTACPLLHKDPWLMGCSGSPSTLISLPPLVWAMSPQPTPQKGADGGGYLRVLSLGGMHQPGPAPARQKHVAQGYRRHPAPQSLDERPSGNAHGLPHFGKLRNPAENASGGIIAINANYSNPQKNSPPPSQISAQLRGLLHLYQLLSTFLFLHPKLELQESPNGVNSEHILF